MKLYNRLQPPVVWDRLTRGLLRGGMDGPGLKPKDLMQLTGPELYLMLSEDGERTFSGAVGMNDSEIEEYRKWYIGLSNRDRLKHAREGTL